MLTYQVTPERSLWFPSAGPDSDVVVASRIALARNLSSLPFVPRMSSDDRLTLRRRLEDAFQEETGTYHALDGEGLSPELKRFYEYRDVLPPEAPTSFAISDSSGQPENDADAVPPPGTATVALGEADHFEIAAMAGGLSLDEPRRRCEQIDRLLEERLDYAVSLQLGYLRPEIARVGSGLSARVSLHLPALEQSGSLDEIDRGTDGEFGLERTAALYRVTCQARAGEAEEATLAALADCSTRLVHYEREARAELIRQHGDAIAEAGHRALGTALHARRLDNAESREIFNLLRFAVAMGLIEGVSLSLATEMMLLSHDSQVVVLTENDTASLDERRARLIREHYRSRAGTGE
jgi:protein arginine kinase